MVNPFAYSQFAESKAYCPRPGLESRLKRHIESKDRVVLVGERRTGKSSLIRELCRKLKKRCYYTDFMSVKSEEDVVKRLAPLLENVPSGSLEIMRRVRPVFEANPATGSTKFSFTVDKNEPLDKLTQYLGELAKQLKRKPGVLVLDEFQGLLSLEEKGRSDYVIASLRSVIQSLNVPVVFVGSVRHLMIQIFTDNNSPFHKSAEIMEVPPITQDEFEAFIIGRFKTGKIVLKPGVYQLLYAASRGITGDVIALCKTIFDRYAGSGKLLDEADITEGVIMHVEKNAHVYAIQAQGLTRNQILCARAIAQYGGTHVNRSEFIKAAEQKSSQAVDSAIQALLKKSILFLRGPEYVFYDPYFGYWVQFNY